MWGRDTLEYEPGICHALATFVMATELDAWFGIYCGCIGLVVCAYVYFLRSITNRKVLFFKEPEKVKGWKLWILIAGPVLVVGLNFMFVYSSTYKMPGKSIKALLGMQIGFYILQCAYVLILVRSKPNKKCMLQVTLGICALLQLISCILSGMESTPGTKNYIFVWNIFPVLWTSIFDFGIYTCTKLPYSFSQTGMPQDTDAVAGSELQVFL